MATTGGTRKTAAKKTAAKKTTAKKASPSKASQRKQADKDQPDNPAIMQRDDEAREPHADTTVLAPERSDKDVKAEAERQVEGGQDLTGHESMVEPDHEYATKRS